MYNRILDGVVANGCILLAFLYAFAECDQERVKLSELEVVSLTRDKFTTSRRSNAIEQLKCVGSYYKCNLYAPYYVQCYNRGYDAGDINWECKADLDKRVKFGEIKISCEGYEYPNDPYVLNGSCGLKYTLESTKSFKNYNDYYNKDLYETSKLSNFLTLIIMIVIISAIYKSCNKHRENDFRRNFTGTLAHVIESQDPNLNSNSLFPPPPPPYVSTLVNNSNNNNNNNAVHDIATIRSNQHGSSINIINQPQQQSNLSQSTTSQIKPNEDASINTDIINNRRSESPPPAYNEQLNRSENR